MTYCCGILVREGLVIIADTRTNAGLDNISTFRKLHIFEEPREKVMMLAAAGNLSVTQTVVSYLHEGLPDPVSGKIKRLLQTSSMLEAATMVGNAIRLVHDTFLNSPQAASVDLGVTFLFGGQLADRRLRLFMVYNEGNFIEATEDTPYLQVGEHKYGKPVLDRAVSFETDPLDALKLGLVSMDSTLRSNLSVGLPLDIALLRRDAVKLEINSRIDETDEYFANLRESWSIALRNAHLKIPRPPYGFGKIGETS